MNGNVASSISKDIIKLTKRENQVLFLLSMYKSRKEIASILSLIENKPYSPNSWLYMHVNLKEILWLSTINVNNLCDYPSEQNSV